MFYFTRCNYGLSRTTEIDRAVVGGRIVCMYSLWPSLILSQSCDDEDDEDDDHIISVSASSRSSSSSCSDEIATHKSQLVVTGVHSSIPPWGPHSLPFLSLPFFLIPFVCLSLSPFPFSWPLNPAISLQSSWSHSVCSKLPQSGVNANAYDIVQVVKSAQFQPQNVQTFFWIHFETEPA